MFIQPIKHPAPTPTLTPNFFVKLEGAYNLVLIGEVFRCVMTSSIRINLLKQENPNQETLLATINKRIKNEMARGCSESYITQFLQNVRLIPKPLSQPTYLFFPGFPMDTQVVQQTDISSEQLKELSACLTIKRSKQKYQQLMKECADSVLLPAALLQWRPETFDHLFKESSCFSESSLVYRLNTLTDRLIQNAPGALVEGRVLLEEAITGNFANAAGYLLSITEVDWHAFFDKGEDLFLLAMSIQSTNDKDRECQMNILKSLYQSRKRLSVTSFSKIIFNILQLYLDPAHVAHQKENHRLLDATISSLLGARQGVDLVQDRARYIGHLFGLEERKTNNEDIDKTLQGDGLEGYLPEDYIWVHLRVFLQKIIETLQAFGSIDERVIHEFLCELETGWVIYQCHNWFQLNECAHRPLINPIIVDYVVRQIRDIAPDTEYVVHTGLPHHTIYVAFKKHQNNTLEIRVDNLGGFSEGQKRHVTTLVLSEPGYAKLGEYLSGLFEISEKCYHKTFPDFETTGRKIGREYAKKIYSPSQFLPLFVRISYPTVPNQRAGNCTHYSFLLGQSIRLQNIHREFFLSLPQVIEKIAQVSASPKGNQALPAKQKVQPITYAVWLQRKLLNHFLTFEGNTSTIPFMKCALLEDRTILDSLVSKARNARILIEGSAGMGKTILSQQLAYQLQSSQELGSVVFYLPLRCLLQNPDPMEDLELIDLVELYILNRPLPFYERKLVENLIHDSNTVWIVDGLDELIIQPHLENALKALFQRRRLIMTSRPHFSTGRFDEIIDLKKMKIFRMDNYKIEQKEELVNFYFASVEQEELKNGLKKVLRRDANPYLKKICEVPISLSTVCQLLISGQYPHILRETNSAVLTEKFVTSLMVNAHRKKRKGSTDSLEKIKKKYSEIIKHLEKLAFMSLEKERRTHFALEIKNRALPKDEDYKRSVEKGLEEIGLLQIDQGGGQFVHATYQEYFAACYVVRGLKCQEATEKYKKVKAFTEKHRNSFQYEQFYLYVAQILKAKIQQIEEGKREEHLSLLIQFLNIYFSDFSTNTDNPQTDTRHLDSRSVSLISVIYEIAQEVLDAEVFKTFVTQQVNPFVREMLKKVKFAAYQDPWCQLQALITGHPYLKNDLGLPEMMLQMLTDLRQPGYQKHPETLNKIQWILDFINHFNIDVGVSFLLECDTFCPANNLSLSCALLKALGEALPKDAILEPVAVQTVDKLIRTVLSSGKFSSHFPIIVLICEKVGKPIHLPTLFTDTLNQLIPGYWAAAFSTNFGDYMAKRALIDFMDCIKTQNPYAYIEDSFIEAIVGAKIQETIFPCIHFLIGYTEVLLKVNNTDTLEKMRGWFQRLFDAYQPPQEGGYLLSWGPSHSQIQKHTTEYVEMLRNLRQSLVNRAAPLAHLVTPIFEAWDNLVVLKDCTKIIQTRSLDGVREFLNHPPTINRFFFKSGQMLKDDVIKLAWGSMQTAKRDNTHRTESWNSITRFFADAQVINLMDSYSSHHVDEILKELLALYNRPGYIHGNSDLPSEIECAITAYRREEVSRNQHDVRRIALIKQQFPYWSTTPEPIQAQQPYQDHVVEKPKPLGFDFDFSYYGYSKTLVQLQHLTKNPKWVQQFMTTQEKKGLEKLKVHLNARIHAVNRIDVDQRLHEQQKQELAIVENLLHQCQLIGGGQ